MRVLNTLYVTGHRAQVRYQRGTLLVVDPDRTNVRVPLETLDGLVILGNGQVTTQALAECVRRNIRVAALSKTGKVRFTCGGPVSGNVLLRVRQYELSQSEQALALAKDVVAGKIQNLRRMVQRWSWDCDALVRPTLDSTVQRLGERLTNVAGKPDLDALRGVEGDATRRYFQALRAVLYRSELPFDIRSRRPPRTPTNALLSFTYALLTAEMVGALDTVGLDPQVGFLHGLRPGRPALALDLIEEFRPALADRFVVGLIRRRQVDAGDFEARPGGAFSMTEEGRVKVLKAYEAFKGVETPHPLLGRNVPRWSLPVVQATLMARYIRGDLPRYPAYVLAA